MKVLHNLSFLPSLPPPIALTIGMFDGVHIGHQKLLQILKAKGKSNVVITFSPHPSCSLTIPFSLPRIYDEEEKLFLLKSYGIDLVLLLPFTQELSKKSAEDFLNTLLSVLPFSYFFRGENDPFGKNRSGKPSEIISWGKKRGIEVEYIFKVSDAQGPISSSRIRSLIAEGNFDEANSLLGRPFGFQFSKGEKELASSLFSFSLEGRCIPPEGDYEVSVAIEGKHFSTSASIQKNPPILLLHMKNIKDLAHLSVTFNATKKSHLSENIL